MRFTLKLRMVLSMFFDEVFPTDPVIATNFAWLFSLRYLPKFSSASCTDGTKSKGVFEGMSAGI